MNSELSISEMEMIQAGSAAYWLCNGAASGLGSIFGTAASGMIAGVWAGPVGVIVGGATSLIASYYFCRNA